MATGIPVENAVAIRYPSSALLCIDSADGELYDRTGFRLDTNTPANLYINRQRPLVFGYFTRVALTELNVQWAIPNVNESNNTLTFQMWDISGAPVLADTYRITVDVGFYTMPELALAIQTAMNTAVQALTGSADTFVVTISGYQLAGTAGTVTINDPYLGIQIDNTLDYNFVIQPYNFPMSVSNPFSPLQDDLTNMLGITPTKSTISYYRALRGSYASMLYTPYFDVVSNLLTKNQNVQDAGTGKFTTSAKLARVYLSNEQIEPRVVTMTYPEGDGVFTSSSDNALACNGGVSFRREFKVPKQIQWNTTENVDVIDLQLIDYRGNNLVIDPTVSSSGGTGEETLSIKNTADFQFTLQVSEV